MLQRDEFLIRELLESGLIDEESVARAKNSAEDASISIIDALVANGAVTSRNLALAQAVVYECSFVDLEDYEINLDNADLLSREVAEKYTSFPLFSIDNVVTIGMLDPMDFRAVDQLRQRIKSDIDPVLCDASALRKLIASAYRMRSGQAVSDASVDIVEDLTTGEEPIVAAVNDILLSAIKAGASDVHIAPDEQQLHLRFRIDGVLIPQQGPPLNAHDNLVRRLKVLSDLDLTQTRKPQDGKFRIDHNGQPFDLRMSVLPTIYGESVVIRILRPTNSFTTFVDLGMGQEVQEQLEDCLRRPHGMILVTGPTGSGKTTTLYTAIEQLNTPDRNIMTAEDPVEIRLPMLRQTQVNKEIDLTFASALRSMLRQDPDVILVGEIRDSETARIATQASMTGHLVLSTLHTNDAVGAIERLDDLGVPPFMLNTSLLCVMAQRLLRKVCSQCATMYVPDQMILQQLGISEEQAGMIRRGSGCSFCKGTGYSGRVGVYEMLRITPELQVLIHDRASSAEIRSCAIRGGMKTMLMDGIEKVLAGQTTLEELEKVRATVDQSEEQRIAQRMSA
ncbi:MAG: GspE/PulE family protein [Phycisphaerales bacterium JB043]